MPSSLSQGAQQKQSTGARILTMLPGSRMRFTGTGTGVNSGRLQIPVGVKPTTCVVGELWMDSANGFKLFSCKTTNTWTQVGTET